MPEENDLENISIEDSHGTDQPTSKKKDIKTSISILTSVRDRLYYNKGAAHSYSEFINELLNFWFEKKDVKEIKKP